MVSTHLEHIDNTYFDSLLQTVGYEVMHEYRHVEQ